jgi:SAP domain-containing new25
MEINTPLRYLLKKELKKIATSHGLLSTGTKEVLKRRINLFFETNICVIIIQKNVRAYFARRLIKAQLITFKNRPHFVNDSDFYTLEPLSTIPFHLIFEYKDERNFSYGFNIESLINLYIKTGKVYNPYNRNRIPMCVMFDLFTIYGLLRIMFKNEIDSNITFIIPSNFLFNMMNMNDTYTDTDEFITLNQVLLVSPRHFDLFNYRSDENIIHLLPLHERTSINVNIMKNKLRTIQENINVRQNQTIERRVREVFMEIDLFGHYTSSLWLSSLSNHNLKVFVVYLREIWLNIANLDEIDRYNIYPFGDPFENIYQIDCVTGCNNLNHCVSIIENFVLSSPHVNDRKLATLFVLTALTRVSSQARRELSWLYESIDW